VDTSGNEVNDEIEVTVTVETTEPEPMPSDLESLIEEYGLFIVLGVVVLIVVPIVIGSRKKNVT
jgi:hypothetical protein